MIQKITFAKHLKYLKVPIEAFFIVLLVYLVVNHFKLMDEKMGSFSTFLIVYFVLIAPGIIVHLQYLVSNRNTKLIINQNTGNMVFVKNNSELKFSFEDIKILYVFKMRSNIEDRMGFVPWEHYHYFKIVLQNNKEILITCLLYDGLENILGNNVTIKVLSIALPFIKKKNTSDRITQLDKEL